MQRIPEPELMDDVTQAEAYAAADFSEAHERILQVFDTCFPGVELCKNGSVDVGSHALYDRVSQFDGGFRKKAGILEHGHVLLAVTDVLNGCEFAVLTGNDGQFFSRIVFRIV